MFKGIKHVFMDEAVGAGGGAAGDGAVDQSAAAATPADTAVPSGSLLAQGQGAPAPLTEFVPEKFRVFKGEGDAREFDSEATLRKVTESYTALEKSRGALGEVPKTAEEYAPKVDVEGFDFAAFKTDPTTAAFLKGAHAKGLTNDQVSYVLESYIKTAPELVQAAKMLDQSACAAELQKVWAEPAVMQKNLTGAFKAFQGVAERAGITLEQAEASGIANNPVFLQLMAALAPEMAEDPGAGGATATPGDTQTIEQLLGSEAYINPKHKDHETVSKRVRDYYAKKFPGA